MCVCVLTRVCACNEEQINRHFDDNSFGQMPRRHSSALPLCASFSGRINPSQEWCQGSFAEHPVECMYGVCVCVSVVGVGVSSALL